MSEDTDNLPLIWERISDRIVNVINDRFDKLENALKVVQGSQKERLEKVRTIEGEVPVQENRISSLEKAFTTLRKENSALKCLTRYRLQAPMLYKW